jgi:hypothetical protein
MGRPCVCACGMGGGRWKKDKVEQSHHYQTQQYLLKLLPPPKAGSRYPSSRGVQDPRVATGIIAHHSQQPAQPLQKPFPLLATLRDLTLSYPRSVPCEGLFLANHSAPGCSLIADISTNPAKTYPELLVSWRVDTIA